MENKEEFKICENPVQCRHLEGMTKDRDKFYKCYHLLSKEKRDNEMLFRKRNERLMKENEYLMTLCLRYEEENEKLKRRLDD